MMIISFSSLIFKLCLPEPLNQWLKGMKRAEKFEEKEGFVNYKRLCEWLILTEVCSCVVFSLYFCDVLITQQHRHHCTNDTMYDEKSFFVSLEKIKVVSEMASGFGYVVSQFHFLSRSLLFQHTYLTFLVLIVSSCDFLHHIYSHIYLFFSRSAKGGVGRCYPFWLDFSECVVRSCVYDYFTYTDVCV